MSRLARLATAIGLAAVLAPLAASPASASTVYDTLHAGLARAQGTLPAGSMTTNLHFAKFEGILYRDANGDYVSTVCYEVATNYPGRVFPCTVAFRFTENLATVCDPPSVDARPVKVGSADYTSQSTGNSVRGNTLTSGGVGSTYRHVHGAIVDMGAPYGAPTAFDIDIDLTEPCTNREAKYPVFTGVVTYL